MAFCGQCGAELRDTARFCPACRAPVGAHDSTDPDDPEAHPPAQPERSPTSPSTATGLPPLPADVEPTVKVAADPPPPEWRSRLPLIVGAALALVIVVAVGVTIIMLTSDDGSTSSAVEGGLATTSPSLLDEDQDAPDNRTTTSRPVDVTIDAPWLGNPDVPPDMVEIAVELTDAITRHDWVAMRRLEPRYAGKSDAEFASYTTGWGDVRLDTVVPVRTPQPGWLDVGLVAQQEKQDGYRQTSVYCMTWAIDTAQRTVNQAGDGSPGDLIAEDAGWVDASNYESQILAQC